MTELREKLEACPFCGSHLDEPAAVSRPYLGLARMHPGVLEDGTCPIAGWGFYAEQLATWNTRATILKGQADAE